MYGLVRVKEKVRVPPKQFGGKLEKAMGVPIESIQESIKRGIRKINVDTDGRLAITGAIRKYMAENPAAFDPRTYFGEAREAVYRTVKGKMEAFGTAGHAGDYSLMTLEDMKKEYN